MTPEDQEPLYASACPNCGSDLYVEDCGFCAEGFTGHDCGEDCCACLHPEDNVPCEECDGTGSVTFCPGCNEYVTPAPVAITEKRS